MLSASTIELIERSTTLWNTGRYANRREAAREARLQLERERDARDAANREHESSKPIKNNE
jgi:Arc/MetJ-type ribon-helix-helix transcriptional regulator